MKIKKMLSIKLKTLKNFYNANYIVATLVFVFLHLCGNTLLDPVNISQLNNCIIFYLSLCFILTYISKDKTYKDLVTLKIVQVTGIASFLLSLFFLDATTSNIFDSSSKSILLKAYHLKILGGVFALLSLRAPLLGVLPVLSFSILKHRDDIIFGTITTSTDYISVVQFCIFLTMCTFLLKLVKKETYNEKNIFFISILFFFAAYFKSGLGKIILKPYFSWIISNPTFSILERAQYLRCFPPAVFNETLSSYIILVLQKSNTVLNIMALLIELSPLLIIIYPNLLKKIIPVYILFHFTVYMLTGVFFFKWIIFLMIVYFFLQTKKLNMNYISKYTRVYVLIFFIVFSLKDFSGSGFKILNLSWFDSPAVNRISIYAVTETSRDLITNNFWLSRSFSILANRYSSAFNNRFPSSSEGPQELSENKLYLLKKIKPTLLSSDENLNSYRIRLSQELLAIHSYYEKSSYPIWIYNFFPHHVTSLGFPSSFLKDIPLKNILFYEVINETGFLTLSTKKNFMVPLTFDRFIIDIKQNRFKD